MLFQKYDYETDKKVYGEECFESGVEDGMKKERLSALESLKKLVALNFEIDDLKNAFLLNDKEVEFILSVDVGDKNECKYR